MGTKAWILILAVAAAIFAVGALLHLRPIDRPAAPPPVEPRTGTTATRADIDRLQAKAEAACRCARPLNDPSNRGCWADFEQDIARFDHAWTGTACMEESVYMECFGPEGPNQLCVFRERPYGACSAAEERSLRAQARARGQSGCSD